MMQTTTVRTQAIADVEIDIDIDADVDVDLEQQAAVEDRLDREIEAILEDLTEHVVPEVRRTDRYRCVSRSEAP
jgi:hypothetical protein